MFKVVKAVFYTLLVILLITFSVENTEPVVLRYYFGFETPPVPVFLLVLTCVLLGILLVGFGYISDEWVLRKTLREKEREIASLESELKPYRERRTVQG